METRLRILHLEDNELDSELIARCLRKAGLTADITRVGNRGDFLTALERSHYDLVLSDFSLPDFDGLSALAAFRDREPLTPFIFVSGTIGEERAVQALHDGATDYVLKDRLSRLPSALLRSIEERREREARRQAEERMREQAALLEQAREAIAVRDPAGRITYWNRGAEQLYGWSAEEALAGAAEACVPERAQGAFAAAWRQVLGEGRWDGTLEHVTRDGREILVESHWTCLGGGDGAARAVLTIGSDVTEARRLESELLRAQRLETVGMIAGGVAHDLNNVLAPILIGITSLRRRVTDDTGRRLLATMETGVERGADIVRQVLTFARGGGPSAGSFDAAGAIRDIEKLLAASLPSNVQLTIEAAPDLWPAAGDATQLQQVLLNLCVNARDAMPKGGRLSVTAANVRREEPPVGGYVRIRVADEGEGMTEEVRRKIFDPFYTTKSHGTGLGLSTVASIVKRHGGFIEVDSEVGRGTEFRVFLPARRVEAEPAPAASDLRGAGELLFVVDERSVREILKETLEAWGYRVAAVETVEDALTGVEAFAHAAAVLLNTSMPGFDAGPLTRLAAAKPNLKIIVSGGDNPLEATGVPAGLVHAALPRPYSPEQLLRTVRRALDTV